MRKRVPGYVTNQKDNDFGYTPPVLEPTTKGGIKPGFDPSGDPVPEHGFPDGENLKADVKFRNVIPPGEIGSREYRDLDVLTLHQGLDTVAMYPGETRDPRLHGAKAVSQEETDGVEFHSYATFTPRRAPMPRRAESEGFLEPYSQLSADPLMTDADSNELFFRRPARTKDLYGENRDGFLHNDGHPGFKAVQGKIEKEGYSKESAGAILASRTRHASKAAHKANPRLNRVKG